MSQNYRTLGDLRDALADYDDETRVRLSADGVELSSVAVRETHDGLIFY